jgi:transcriptional regulator
MRSAQELGSGADRPEQKQLVLLFTSLLTIPLSRQRFLHAALLARLQVEGMTFYFLNDVFLLDLTLKPAQCIFKRLAFLNANLCQGNYTSRRPLLGNQQITGNRDKESINGPPVQDWKSCHFLPFAIFSSRENGGIGTSGGFFSGASRAKGRFPVDIQLEGEVSVVIQQEALVGEEKSDVLQGTLDLMVLKTLEAMGPLHGYGIARRIEQISEQTLHLNQGTIYPALLRLRQRGWIRAEWGTSENGRRARYYELTRAGKAQIEKETESWERVAAVMARFLKTASN